MIMECFDSENRKDHNLNLIMEYIKSIRSFLFISVRFFLWIITFWACIPAPMGWLRGVVIESGIDWEMCLYYFRGDAIMFAIYLINLFVWSLPFVKIQRMWNKLRVDIFSLLVSIFLLTSSYLVYVEYVV